MDYAFYTDTYLGTSIQAADFPRLSTRATAQLARYKRMYRVTAPAADSENLAVCALADTIYYYEQVTNGAVAGSVSVGSVSASAQLPDTSPAAQAAELLRAAGDYLQIYRGAS